jgi:hypothetical protein
MQPHQDQLRLETQEEMRGKKIPLESVNIIQLLMQPHQDQLRLFMQPRQDQLHLCIIDLTKLKDANLQID